MIDPVLSVNQCQQRWQDWLQQFAKPAPPPSHPLPLKALTVADLPWLLSKDASIVLRHSWPLAAALKRQRFGPVVSLFAPLYLSNLCSNECSYCGFYRSANVSRTILSPEQALTEVTYIQKLGLHQVLLVTGEHERKVGVEYLAMQIQSLRARVSWLGLECQPLTQAAYQQLAHIGLDQVAVYQETYDPKAYAKHHLFGKKTEMEWRLDTPDRVGRAGIAKISMGVLLGLSDWRLDLCLLIEHIVQLQRAYPALAISVALPRLRPCYGQTEQQSGLSDLQYLQALAAVKCVLPDVELVQSTRDSAPLRDLILTELASSASAGSQTAPGGYAAAANQQAGALAQFVIDDKRSPAEICQMLRRHQVTPLLKDWLAPYGRSFHPLHTG